VLFHDNARPYTTARTSALLQHFNWELSDHPPDRLLLTPSNYLKNWLILQSFSNRVDGRCQNVVERKGGRILQTYSPHKCLNSGGDYAKKQRVRIFVCNELFPYCFMLTARLRLLPELFSYWHFQCAAVVMFQYWISPEKQATSSRANVSSVCFVLVQPSFRPLIAWELGNTR
jgi:hypothetical protein